LTHDTNGWSEYEKLVMSTLERYQTWLENINLKLEQVNTEITKLKIKAGVWGALAGMIPVAITILIYLLMKK